MRKIADHEYLLGDVHAGRKFLNGTPLDRRGVREEWLINQFRKHLLEDVTAEDTVFQLGDLLDAFSVPLEVLAELACIINESLATLCFVAGNHDKSKDENRVSALSILQMLCPKAIFVIDYPKVVGSKLLVPWSYTETIEQQLSHVEPGLFPVIMGHWDLPCPSGLFDRLAPGGKIYSGHIHLPSVEGSCEWIGSMQPLAHGECPNEAGQLYRTVTLPEYNAAGAEAWRDLVVRILLQPGEDMPTEHCCLQLTSKRVNEEETVTGDELSLAMGGLNIAQIIREELKETGRADEVIQKFEERLACSTL